MNTFTKGITSVSGQRLRKGIPIVVHLVCLFRVDQRMLSDFQISWRAFLKLYILFSHVAKAQRFPFFFFFCLTKGRFRRQKVKYSYLTKENLSIGRHVKEL